MKENDIYSELQSIRSLMERSSKFISLSGLSGILAGLYALIGAGAGYRLLYQSSYPPDYSSQAGPAPELVGKLFLIAVAILGLSLLTGLWLTIRQAQKKKENVWNPVSKRLLASMSVPLVSGGIFILILVSRGEYAIIAPACLIFYGLALVAGSAYTFSDVKWLGFCEIALGLAAALLPGYGIIFWVIGFGLLHILYGSVMHFKYNQ